MKKIFQYVFVASVVIFSACQKNLNNNNGEASKAGGVPPQQEVYVQGDQMARPAINTVFVGSSRKNEFNTTTPTAMDAAFKTDFINKLTAFGYTTNILGLDKNISIIKKCRCSRRHFLSITFLIRLNFSDSCGSPAIQCHIMRFVCFPGTSCKVRYIYSF